MLRPTTAWRFAAVGVANTVLDLTLFMLLHDALGLVAANAVSTSAGMACSFFANGRFTFGAERLTVRHAALFVATTGVTMWLVQPLVIRGLLEAAYAVGAYPGAALLLIAKVLAIGVSVTLNFVAYRFVVWPVADGRVSPSPQRQLP